jgi:hypothetical protein
MKLTRLIPLLLSAAMPLVAAVTPRHDLNLTRSAENRSDQAR